MRYVKFKDGEQNLFLRKVKHKVNLSWRQLSDFLGVNRSMVFFYLGEHSKLPQHSYKKLCNIAKMKVKEHKFIEISNTPKEIKLPKLSEKFAEFIGALAGDGHVN